MDMVNPMDARKPMPISLLGVMPSEKVAIFSFLSSNVEPTMPIGLPSNRPSITPVATLVEKIMDGAMPENEIPAFASANIGMMTNDTMGCIARSSL